MKRLSVKNVSMIALVAATLNACSKNVEIEPVGGKPKAPAASKLAKSYFGDWTTECLVYPIGGGTYYTKALKINAKELDYQERFFRDANCAQESDEANVRKGKYSVTKVLKDGRQAVELKVPLGPNMWQNWDFNLKIEKDTLLMSEFYSSAFDKAEGFQTTYKFAKKQPKNEVTPPKEVPVLVSGDYQPTSGSMNLCPQNVGVAKNRETGKVIEIWISILPPCVLVTRPYACDDLGVCTYEGRTATILTEKSYRFDDPAEGLSAVFEML